MAVSKEFDIDRLKKLFIICRNENDGLDMDSYIDAYDELSKLFRIFGTVFGFVASDVDEKVGILREYRSLPEKEEFKTIQSMIQYEMRTKTTKTMKASRTLLRLHRALEFVLEFMQEISNADDSVRMSEVGSQAYDRTLAKFHPWLIRKGVHIAVYTLPNRKHLLQKMKIPDEKAKEVLVSVIEVGRLIYDETQELYTTNNLLNLP
ncbi:ceramide-1-phosphate transfer protein-like [Gigantopelta aegis]|uniref:ceramide-1-phosphate transfer protein-like n=1 Tax=Gigantopelta aegis TaxID=1735272 RepID=UPI001B88D184|nr:ceramide-1-phosphate transfer protein-like [Gigantopelta aegis]